MNVSFAKCVVLICTAMAVCRSADAALIVIDDFNDPYRSISISGPSPSPGVGVSIKDSMGAEVGSDVHKGGLGASRFGEAWVSSMSNLEIYGFERDMRLDGGSGSSFTIGEDVPGNGRLSNGNGTSAGSTLLLQYDGNAPGEDHSAGAPNAATVGGGFAAKDFTDGGSNTLFLIDGVVAQGTVSFILTVFTANGSAIHDNFTTPSTFGTNANPASIQFLFSDFDLSTGFDGFDEITGINLQIVTTASDDVSFGQFVATNPEPASMIVWSMLTAGGMGLAYVRRRKVAA